MSKIAVVNAPHIYICQILDMIGFKISVWGKDKYVKQPDLLVFSDSQNFVSPCTVGQRTKVLSVKPSFNIRKEWRDKRMFLEYGSDVPRLGFGNGAITLNVLNNGDFVQEANNHNLFHNIRFTKAKDSVVPGCPSNHTQMMIPSKVNESLLLASACSSTKKVYHTHDEESTHNEWEDPEILFYPNTTSLCWQPTIYPLETYPLAGAFLSHFKQLTESGDF